MYLAVVVPAYVYVGPQSLQNELSTELAVVQLIVAIVELVRMAFQFKLVREGHDTLHSCAIP